MDATKVSVTWDPPVLPNGEILAYSMTIRSLDGKDFAVVKELAASEKRHHIFADLHPNTVYKIQIAANNAEGQDLHPNTVYKIQIAANNAEGQESSADPPYLIFTAGTGIFLQDVFEVWSEPYILHRAKSDDASYGFLDVDMDARTGTYFVSDTDGYVYSASVTSTDVSPLVTILTPGHLGGRATKLSVDWLGKQLYVLTGTFDNNSKSTRWQIWQCSYDGKSGLRSVIRDFGARTPTFFRVEMVFGYIYWVEDGFDGSHLKRLDLGAVKLNAVSAAKAEEIFVHPSLGPFVILHANFSLLIVDHGNKTVLEVPFQGGSTAKDVRPSSLVIKSGLDKVTDICYHSGQLFWTTPSAVFYEDGDGTAVSHNAFLGPVTTDGSSSGFQGIALYHVSSQPVPVPATAPKAVEVLFGANSAEVTWLPPIVSDALGEGSWSDWKYEVSYSVLGTSATSSAVNLTGMSYLTDNLRPSETYSIKVRAYSEGGGFGPWSENFVGKTFPNEQLVQLPKFIVASDEMIGVSDVFGKTDVYPSAFFEDFSNTFPVKSIVTADENRVLLAMKDSDLLWFDLRTKKMTKLGQVSSASAVAYDWIGRKIYWSDSSRLIICRSDLNGNSTEFLPLSGIVSTLTLDPVRGFLYFSTVNTVESAALNGSNPVNYFREDIYSGKRVVGMTLNFDEGKIHWMVRSAEGVVFHHAFLRGFENNKTKENDATIFAQDFKGPLVYFQDRFAWLQSDEFIVIGDSNFKNLAKIKIRPTSGGRFGKLTAFGAAFVHSRPLPGPVCIEMGEAEKESLAKLEKLPLLGVASEDSVEVLDAETSKIYASFLTKLRSWPEAVVHDSHKNETFWADGDFYIYKDHQQLLKRKKKTTAMAFDWIGRYIYWSEEHGSIFRLDLSAVEKESILEQTVADRGLGLVHSMHFNPFKSELVLAEEGKDGFQKMLKISIDQDFQLKPFFNSQQNCSCAKFAESADASSGPFALDFSEKSRFGKAIFYDEKADEIWESSSDGCQCRKLLSFVSKRGRDHSPRSLAIPGRNVYWFNADSLHSLRTDESPVDGNGKDLFDKGSPGILLNPRILFTLDQPFPKEVFECLKPVEYKPVPKLAAQTPVKLSLAFEAPKFHPECSNFQPISKPTYFFKICHHAVIKAEPKFTAKAEFLLQQVKSVHSIKTSSFEDHHDIGELAQDCLIKEVDFKASTVVEIGSLQPKTNYSFEIFLENVHFQSQFGPGTVFHYKTIGFRPHKLDPPVVLKQGSTGFTIVRWEAVKTPVAAQSDSEIVSNKYILEGKRSSSPGFHWTVIYKGSETSYNFTHQREARNLGTIVNDTTSTIKDTTSGTIITSENDQKWVFRVAAENEFGLGEFSEPSKSLLDAEPLAMLTETAELAVVVGAACLAVVIIALAAYGCLLGAGHDLATLTDLPRHARFIEETNEFYRPSNDMDDGTDGAAGGPTAEEMGLLPKIRRQHITLTKFLGSGAFGEVFEGLAKGLPVFECLKPVEYKPVPKLAAQTPVKLSLAFEAPKFHPECSNFQPISKPTYFFKICHHAVIKAEPKFTAKAEFLLQQVKSVHSIKTSSFEDHHDIGELAQDCLIKEVDFKASTVVEIGSLQPKTNYSFEIFLENVHFQSQFGPGTVFHYKTIGFRPHKLDPPVVLKQGSTGFTIVRWEAVKIPVASQSDSEIVSNKYILEGKRSSSPGFHWTVIYKGS
ncbi:unnamed protein product, partial [Notodromas monacha]